MEISALITGRGNNTFKDKNIFPVLGKPLLWYPAKAVSECSYITSKYISSDDDKILDSIDDLNYSKIKRPPELGLPNSKHIDVVRHAISVIEKDKGKIDILVLVLANSATILTEWITEGIETIIANPSIDSVVAAQINQDHHPYRAKKINNRGFIEPYFDFTNIEVSSNRQELPVNLFICQTFYVLNLANNILSKEGQKPFTVIGQTCKPIIVSECFDVHDMNDILATEEWVKKYIYKKEQ